jgi:hypothetical protein
MFIFGTMPARPSWETNGTDIAYPNVTAGIVGTSSRMPCNRKDQLNLNLEEIDHGLEQT